MKLKNLISKTEFAAILSIMGFKSSSVLSPSPDVCCMWRNHEIYIDLRYDGQITFLYKNKHRVNFLEYTNSVKYDRKHLLDVLNTILNDL